MNRRGHDFTFERDPNSPEPLYRQLRDALRDYIVSRFDEEDAALPGAVELAAQIGVGRNTVIRALELLVQEKLIMRVHRRGTCFGRSICPELRRNLRVGVMFPQVPGDVNRKIVEAVCGQLSELRVRFSFFPTVSGNTHQHRALAEKIASEFDVLIFQPSSVNFSLLRQLAETGLPTVLYDTFYPAMPTVSIDYHSVGWQLAARLLQMGKRRIGILRQWPNRGQAMFNNNDLIDAGRRQALNLAGIVPEPGWDFAPSDDRPERIIAYLRRSGVDSLIVASFPGQMTVLTLNSPVREHLLERGILLSGYSEKLIDPKYRPAELVAMQARPRAEEIGRELAKLALKYGAEPKLPPVKLLIAPEIVDADGVPDGASDDNTIDKEKQ